MKRFMTAVLVSILATLGTVGGATAKTRAVTHPRPIVVIFIENKDLYQPSTGGTKYIWKTGPTGTKNPLDPYINGSKCGQPGGTACANYPETPSPTTFKGCTGGGSGPADGFAPCGTVFTNYYSTRHNSLLDYLAVTAGATKGPSGLCTDDNCPNTDIGYGKDLFSKAQSAGLDFKYYNEDMGHTAYCVDHNVDNTYYLPTNSGSYVNRHNALLREGTSSSTATACTSADDVNLATSTGSSHSFLGTGTDQLDTNNLADFTLINANQCHNSHETATACTHDGGITWMDVFFQVNLPQIIGGYGNYDHVHPTVIIVTDEAVQTDDNRCNTVSGPGDANGHCGGQVFLGVVGNGVSADKGNSTDQSHYTLLAAIDDRFGFTRQGGACDSSHPNTNFATCSSPLTPALPIGS